MTGIVRDVQFRGPEVDESVQEKGNPLLVADESHASGRIDALSACLPANPVRESHVAQDASSSAPPPPPVSSPEADTHRLVSNVGSPESVPVEVFRQVCSWCGRVYGHPEGTRDTHGLCPEDFQKQMEQIKQRRADMRAKAMAALAEALEAHPDLRICQLIGDVVPGRFGRDPYHVTDSLLLESLIKFMGEAK